ncbi:hypothetical protein K488DRAFT_65159, partial [Vararia minispora EC-137]
RARLLFSFKFEEVVYPCVLIDRFKRVGQAPDAVTGMWKVRPEVVTHGRHSLRQRSVEHLDSVLRAAHLMPVYGYGTLPRGFDYRWTLDAFKEYYVNKYVDYHAREIAF